LGLSGSVGLDDRRRPAGRLDHRRRRQLHHAVVAGGRDVPPVRLLVPLRVTTEHLMDRRRFMQLAGLARLGFVAPMGPSVSRADDAKYKGPFWIMVNASGGWDPTFFCDPKGGAVDTNYTANQIKKAGNISYAPVSGLTGDDEVFYTTQQFFESWNKRLLVI